MSTLFVLLILIGFFLLIVVLGGLFLPKTWVIEEAVLIHARPAELYATVGNLERWSEWMTWVPKGSKVKQTSAPVVEIADSGRINGQVTLTQQTPPREVHYRFDVAEGQLLVHGTLVLDAADLEYTQLAWRCRLEPLTDNHPIRRYQAYFLKNYFESAVQSSFNTLLEQFELSSE